MLAADAAAAVLAIAVVIIVGARSITLRNGGTGKRQEPRTSSSGLGRDQAFFDREFAGITSHFEGLSARTGATETEELVRAFGGNAGLLRDVRPTTAPGTVSLVSEVGALRLRLTSAKEAARLCDIGLSGDPASYSLNVSSDGARISIVTPNAQITLRGEILPG